MTTRCSSVLSCETDRSVCVVRRSSPTIAPRVTGRRGTAERTQRRDISDPVAPHRRHDRRAQRHPRRRRHRRLASPAAAADNPYQRGPDPTRSSIQAARGSFAVSQTRPRAYGVSGFGGGPSTTRPTSPRARSVRSPSPPATPPGSRAWRGSRRASRPRASWCSPSTQLGLRPAGVARRPAARGRRLPHPAQRGGRPGRRQPPRRHGPLDGRRRDARGDQGPPVAQGGGAADAVEHRQDLARGPDPDDDHRRPERLRLAGRVARDPVLQELPSTTRERTSSCAVRRTSRRTARTRPSASTRWPGSSGSSTTTPATSRSCARPRPAPRCRARPPAATAPPR